MAKEKKEKKKPKERQGLNYSLMENGNESTEQIKQGFPNRSEVPMDVGCGSEKDGTCEIRD